jgi:hypothetical protein
VTTTLDVNVGRGVIGDADDACRAVGDGRLVNDAVVGGAVEPTQPPNSLNRSWGSTHRKNDDPASSGAANGRGNLRWRCGTEALQVESGDAACSGAMGVPEVVFEVVSSRCDPDMMGINVSALTIRPFVRRVCRCDCDGLSHAGWRRFA